MGIYVQLHIIMTYPYNWRFYGAYFVNDSFVMYFLNDDDDRVKIRTYRIPQCGNGGIERVQETYTYRLYIGYLPIGLSHRG